jgi:hypothetical protein
MPEDSNSSKPRPNPLLAATEQMFEAIAPGGLDDTEQAWRELVPRLRFVVIARVQSPTTKQLEALRRLSEFKQSNLLQIRKAIQTSDLRLGPFPEKIAEQALVPALAQDGFTISLQELSAEEKAKQLEFLDNPSAYFRKSNEKA